MIESLNIPVSIEFQRIFANWEGALPGELLKYDLGRDVQLRLEK